MPPQLASIEVIEEEKQQDLEEGGSDKDKSVQVKVSHILVDQDNSDSSNSRRFIDGIANSFASSGNHRLNVKMKKV